MYSFVKLLNFMNSYTFAPAAVHLRRTLWAATPGITLESLQREGELYRRFRLGCPTERAWGNVHTIC
jgi:hypothetical protein